MQISEVNHIEIHNDIHKQIHNDNKFIISAKTYVKTLVNFDVFSVKIVYKYYNMKQKITCENR